MFLFWLILGLLVILLGVFDRQILRLLGIKPMSEVFTIPRFTHSSRVIEKLGRWLVITLGITFLLQGPGRVLPNDMSALISFALLGFAGLMILVMIGITIATWNVR